VGKRGGGGLSRKKRIGRYSQNNVKLYGAVKLL
jgi:hypothetical protein